MELTNLTAYRMGHIYKESLANIFCCHIAEVQKPVLDYLELIYADGSRRFVYENIDDVHLFEEDLYQNRFTSFHEFLTTEETAVEERGILKLTYYKRRPREDYECMPLAEAKAKLEEAAKEAGSTITALPDRLTQLGHYDQTVDYHM